MKSPIVSSLFILQVSNGFVANSFAASHAFRTSTMSSTAQQMTETYTFSKSEEIFKEAKTVRLGECVRGGAQFFVAFC